MAFRIVKQGSMYGVSGPKGATKGTTLEKAKFRFKLLEQLTKGEEEQPPTKEKKNE